MKKSLRQLLAVTLSMTLLTNLPISLVAAEEASSNESETENVMSVEEMDSEAQRGLDTALETFEAEYPDSKIHEITVEVEIEDNDDVVYEIEIEGLDAELNQYELEIEWVNNEVRQQEFNEGWLNDDEDDDEEDRDEDAVEESIEDDREFEEQTIDLEEVITLDEATEIAMEKVNQGQIVEWQLKADTEDIWTKLGFTEQQNENPIWKIEIEDLEADNETEVYIDAISGEIINPQEVQEDVVGASVEQQEEVAESSIEEDASSAESEIEASEESAESEVSSESTAEESTDESTTESSEETEQTEDSENQTSEATEENNQ